MKKTAFLSREFLWLLILCLAFSLLPGCSGGGGGGSSSSSSSSSSSGGPDYNVLDTQQTYVTASGGVLESSTVQDAVKVDIPSGALSGTSQVTYRVLDKLFTPPANSQARLVGHPVELSFNGGSLTGLHSMSLRTTVQAGSGEVLLLGYRLENGQWLVWPGNSSSGQTSTSVSFPKMIEKGKFDPSTFFLVAVFSIRNRAAGSNPPMNVFKYSPPSSIPDPGDLGTWDSYESGNWTGTKVALLVHGYLPFCFDATELDGMKPLAKHLFEKNYTVYGVRYTIGYTLTQLGDKLSELIKSRVSGTIIDVFAHSTGGLVARRAIEKSDGASSKVRRLFTMGTPHGGVDKALTVSIIVNDLFASGLDLLPELDDLSEPSSFLAILNQPSNIPCQYYLLVGTDPTRDEHYGLCYLSSCYRLATDPVDLHLDYADHSFNPFNHDHLIGHHDGLIEVISAGRNLNGECANFTPQIKELPLSHDYIKRASTVLNQIDAWLGNDTPTTGTVTGKITDSTSSGPAIIGATVNVSSTTGSNFSATTATDSSGNYTVSNVPAGYCNVQATKSGYVGNSKGGTVVAGGTLTVNIPLTPVPVDPGDLDLTIKGGDAR